MLRFPLFLLLSLLALAAPALAQTTISGTVRDSLTRQPLPFASVFLLNTTRGATADAQGHYVLPQVPAGSYELAATFVGYKLRQRAVAVGSSPVVLDVALPPAAQALAEVVVRPNPHREADYQRFLELFLGTSTRAAQCRVRDPNAVLVDYDGEAHLLTATVPHQLVVDNLALGYQLTFYDLDFRADFSDGGITVSTLSRLAFRELPGSAGKQRRWAANRRAAYYGSQTHFLRAVYANKVAASGFEAQRLRRVPNRRWLVADSIRRAIFAAGGLGQVSVPDSIWRRLKEPPVFAYLYKPLLPPDSLRRVADGRVWLRFRDLLAVTYLRGKPDANYHQLGLTLEPGRENSSVLHLNGVRETELDASGTPAQPLDVQSEGYWGFEKLGDLLPLDYVPDAAAP